MPSMQDLHALQQHCKTPAQARAISALIANNGNVAQAAKALGIARSSLREVRDRVLQQAGKLLPLEAITEEMRLRGVSTLTQQEDGSKQWVKTERASDDPPAYPVVPTGFAITNQSSYVDGQGQVRGQHISVERGKAEQFAALEQALRDSVASIIAPLPPVAAPTHYTPTELLQVYPLGDPHIGALSWAAETGNDHDLKIAEQDLCAAMDRLVAGSPATHLADVVNLGDFYHAEDDQQRTPGHGHKLDVDSRSGKVARVGINIMRRLIARALEKHARVRVHNLRGNHDPMTALWLALVLEGWYAHEPRVEIVPNLDAFAFVEFGKCMFMYTHGDGPKVEQLESIMAARDPELWGRTRFRYSHGGHVHHQVKKEFRGMVHESHRSLVGKDAWHYKNGYFSGQSLSGITYHGEYGEIERKTVDITLARAGALVGA